MTDADTLMHDLIAMSVRLQECEYIAKRAGKVDLAKDFRDLGDKVAADVRRLMKPNALAVLS